MPSSRLGCPLSLKTPNMGNTGQPATILIFSVDSGVGDGVLRCLPQVLSPTAQKNRRNVSIERVVASNGGTEVKLLTLARIHFGGHSDAYY